MGRKSVSGGVTPYRDRIQVRFEWQGIEYRPTLNLKPTQVNLRSARREREDILNEIQRGVFSMEAHFPNFKYKAKIVQDEVTGSAASLVPAHRRNLSQWADVYFELLSRTKAHSTQIVYKRHMDGYWLNVWGNANPREITHEAIMLRLSNLNKGYTTKEGVVQKPLAPKTQNNILIPLRGVFKQITTGLKHFTNPAEDIENLKIEYPEPDPFTPQEVELILNALRRQGEEIADYFEFAMFAGLRDSEQIALLWKEVDMLNKTLVVRRARVLGETKNKTKTNRKRTVELNSRAAAVLERQAARTRAADKEVFMSTETKSAWHDDQGQRKAFKKAIDECGVRYRPPKECRDTSVTMALMAGADPAWVAAQHGHSMETMQRSYAKWLPKGDGNRNLNRVNEALSASGYASADH
jgi:integrase